MCGRFSQSESSRRPAEVFRARLAEGGLAEGSHNVAPTATIRVVLERDEERRLAPAAWGFRPPWPSRDGKPAPSWINAEGETAAESRAFGPALRRRRCVIPVDAFYSRLVLGRKGAACGRSVLRLLVPEVGVESHTLAGIGVSVSRGACADCRPSPRPSRPAAVGMQGSAPGQGVKGTHIEIRPYSANFPQVL
jgi:hypothetical protein